MSMKTFEERVETPRALQHQVPARESGREKKDLKQKTLCRHSGIERPHVCEARGAAEKGNSSKQPTQREQPIIFHVRGGRNDLRQRSAYPRRNEANEVMARRCRIGSRHTARGWGQIFRMHCCDPRCPMIMESFARRLLRWRQNGWIANIGGETVGVRDKLAGWVESANEDRNASTSIATAYSTRSVRPTQDAELVRAPIAGLRVGGRSSGAVGRGVRAAESSGEPLL
jgi:hypothetical protein